MAANTETTMGSTCASSSLAAGLGTLLVRVMMGIIFIYYSGQFLFGMFDGRGIHAFIQMLSSDHLPILPPTAWAYLAGITQFFGGILIIVGLLSRIVSIVLILNLIGIIYLSYAGGFGSIDFQLALISIAGLILISGPGMLSMDAAIFRGKKKK